MGWFVGADVVQQALDGGLGGMGSAWQREALNGGSCRRTAPIALLSSTSSSTASTCSARPVTVLGKPASLATFGRTHTPARKHTACERPD